jgi:hypothetical protein
LARRHRFVDPVATSSAPDTAGGFRAHNLDANGRAKDQQQQDVKASVKREARFRAEPVKDNQRVGG